MEFFESVLGMEVVGYLTLVSCDWKPEHLRFQLSKQEEGKARPPRCHSDHHGHPHNWHHSRNQRNQAVACLCSQWWPVATQLAGLQSSSVTGNECGQSDPKRAGFELRTARCPGFRPGVSLPAVCVTLSNVARSAPCPTRGALTPHREPQLRWSRAWRQEARGWEQSAGVAALTQYPLSLCWGQPHA